MAENEQSNLVNTFLFQRVNCTFYKTGSYTFPSTICCNRYVVNVASAPIVPG